MVEKVTIGNCTLYRGDSLDVLPLLCGIDVIVTSPPYDGLREYGVSGSSPIEIIPLITNTLSEGAVVMWNVADQVINGSETGTSFRHALAFMDSGLRLHDTMIYCKENVNFPCATRYHAGFEYMFVFSKGAPRTFNPLKDRLNKWRASTMHGTDRQPNGDLKPISGKGKIISDYGKRMNWWVMYNNGPDNGHPAPMPYSMAHDHITSWTDAGALILDPFMGGGTTGVAATKLGRAFIGIEIDPEYFAIACKRIEEAQRQPDMLITSEFIKAATQAITTQANGGE